MTAGRIGHGHPWIFLGDLQGQSVNGTCAGGQLQSTGEATKQ